MFFRISVSLIIITYSRSHSYSSFYPLTDPPSINLISGNITVNDRDSVTLTCTADGFPAPNITWTRLLDNSSVPETFNITGKQDEGYYRCTADNGIGNPATGDIFITVKSKSKPSYFCVFFLSN